MKKNWQRPLWALLFALSVMLGVACSPTASEGEVPELALKLTASAVPPAGTTGEAPATPLSRDELEVKATALAVELQTTATAAAEKVIQSDVDKFATEEPLRRELATYGVLEGRLTGLYEPVSLEQTEEGEYSFYRPSFAAHARDFVVAADITWDSASEDSGCGFVFRSNGEEEALNQYIMGVTRAGSLLFTEQINGVVDSNQVLEINVPSKDPAFQAANGTTNRIAIVGRGQRFTMYSNGQMLETITAQRGLEDGFVTFIAVNDSGGIRCDFNNAWLWEIN